MYFSKPKLPVKIEFTILRLSVILLTMTVCSFLVFSPPFGFINTMLSNKLAFRFQRIVV